jgi:demethylmenaquinone methyltransferase/2-methoxy-6-polyprenyl-1,4-benzoquinol methylase
MNLPVASESVNAATIAFGIRNVMQPEAACRELFRVLRPGGRLAILEFAHPQLARVRPRLSLVFAPLLPRIGRAVSRHDAAYTYLPESIGAFAYGDEFARILTAAGFHKSRPGH